MYASQHQPAPRTDGAVGVRAYSGERGVCLSSRQKEGQAAGDNFAPPMGRLRGHRWAQASRPAADAGFDVPCSWERGGGADTRAGPARNTAGARMESAPRLAASSAMSVQLALCTETAAGAYGPPEARLGVPPAWRAFASWWLPERGEEWLPSPSTRAEAAVRLHWQALRHHATPRRPRPRGQGPPVVLPRGQLVRAPPCFGCSPAGAPCARAPGGIGSFPSPSPVCGSVGKGGARQREQAELTKRRDRGLPRL